MITKKARHRARWDRTNTDEDAALHSRDKNPALRTGGGTHKYLLSTTTTIIIFIRKRQASCPENGKKSVGMKEGDKRNR